MRNRAFTMVELLAAVVLSTLLFITAITVIRSLGHTRPAGRDSASAWSLAARQQLEWDLENAVVLRQDEHGLLLGGYGSLDPATFAPTHAPVLVNYSLCEIGSRRWLVREQSSLDPLVTDLNSKELLCGDVKSFAVTGSYGSRAVADDTTTIPEQDQTPIIFQRIGGAQRIPDRVRVRIDLENYSMPLMNTVIYLR